MKNKYMESKWYDIWITDTVISILLGFMVFLIRWSVEDKPEVLSMVLTSVGMIVIVMIFAIRRRVGQIEIEVREHNGELVAGDEIDNLLMQLQTRLREVRLHRSAVFRTYCKQELEGFVMRVARAAQQGELIVNEHHFSTLDDVLAAFGGQKNRVYRGVWGIEEGERLFDTAWQHYMKELVELTESWCKTKKITVELLLVVDKQETLGRLAVEIVVGYLRAKKKKGITYRIITEETYEELVSDSRLNTRYLDFGVYGDELLYRTESYEPKLGMFSEDAGTIRAYRRTHEAAMRSAKALPDPAGAEDHADLEKFLQADELEEKERGKKRSGTMLGKLVKIATADCHVLDGILYEAEDSIATVVHVHGSLGNFYHQSFIPVFAQILTREGIRLLSCNMRTHDGIAEGYDTNGNMKYVGGSLARFETCVKDIQGAVRWSRKLGQKVYLQGHSLGCDRVLHYLESTKEELSPILLSPCDSRELQKEWLGVERFKQQEADLQERKKERAIQEENAWSLAPQGTYGLKGGDDWTYEIPVTEEVLESILLGAPWRILAVEKDAAEISRAQALAYLGRSDPIRGTSLETMKAHLKVVLPRVSVIEGRGGHNMEDCEEETARGIAEWIKRVERGD